MRFRLTICAGLVAAFALLVPTAATAAKGGSTTLPPIPIEKLPAKAVGKLPAKVAPVPAVPTLNLTVVPDSPYWIENERVVVLAVTATGFPAGSQLSLTGWGNGLFALTATADSSGSASFVLSGTAGVIAFCSNTLTVTDAAGRTVTAPVSLACDNYFSG